MTTATLTGGIAATRQNNQRPGGRSGRSLEELARNLVETLFGTAPGTWDQSVGRGIHDARRLRRRGDLDGALAVLEGMDASTGTPDEARWAHAEWADVVRRRFGDREVLVYNAGPGRAAALTPVGNGRLEALAVLGMRWRSGKIVSQRSLKGLRPLRRGGKRRRR